MEHLHLTLILSVVSTVTLNVTPRFTFFCAFPVPRPFLPTADEDLPADEAPVGEAGQLLSPLRAPSGQCGGFSI